MTEAQTPVAYASAGQLNSLADRPDDEGGVYIPLRKTPLGMFRMPLYASPASDEVVQALLASLQRLLLEFDFLVEDGTLPDIRGDVIFVDARAVIAKATAV
jgi:hypothetical protein